MRQRVSYRPYSIVVSYNIDHVMNKLSLVGMQLPEKYKDLSKGLRSNHQNSPYIFQIVVSLPTKACSYYWHYLH
jgi:hypothetical protein